MSPAPEHRCTLPDVSVWLYTEGDAEIVCPECGAQWGPAYGFGQGDMSGWVRVS
jgi:hypothetical protein